MRLIIISDYKPKAAALVIAKGMDAEAISTAASYVLGIRNNIRMTVANTVCGALSWINIRHAVRRAYDREIIIR